MKNLLIYISIFLYIVNVSAQSDKYWLHKYWAYRERFNEHFVRVGSGRGMSIPVQSHANKGEPVFPNGSTNDYAATGKLYFGDCTSHWGYYVGMLATEYGLLYNNGHYSDAQQTLKEIVQRIYNYLSKSGSCNCIPTCSGIMKNYNNGDDSMFPESLFMFNGFKLGYNRIFNGYSTYELSKLYIDGHTINFKPINCTGYNLGMAVQQVALCNSYYLRHLFFDCHKNKAKEYIEFICTRPPVPARECSIPMNKLGWYVYFDMQIFDLLRAFLYNDYTGLPKSTFEEILESAPCNGPDVGSPSGWCTDNRWANWFKSQCISGNNSGHYYHSGVDYMLFYNLFCLVYGVPAGGYTKTPDLNFYHTVNYTNSFPVPGPDIGSKTNPYTGKAGYINTTSLIKSTADVRFVASFEINLNDGFEVQPGGDFLARVGALQCNPSTTHYERKGQETTETKNETYEFMNEEETEIFATEKDTQSENTCCTTKNENLITVYPNPSTGNVRIEYHNAEHTEMQIIIFNTNQEKVAVFSIPAHLTEHSYQDITLPKGVYFVQTIQENSVKTIKLVVL